MCVFPWAVRMDMCVYFPWAVRMDARVYAYFPWAACLDVSISLVRALGYWCVVPLAILPFR